MLELEVKILDKNSTKTFSGLEERGIESIDLKIKEVIISEAAAGGGRTGVFLLLQDAEGKYYCAGTTADMIEYGITASIRGANAKWGVPPKP